MVKGFLSYDRRNKQTNRDYNFIRIDKEKLTEVIIPQIPDSKLSAPRLLLDLNWGCGKDPSPSRLSLEVVLEEQLPIS